MALEVVHGALSWSGEHWICMLREPGSDDTAVVSHYHLRVSPAGPGNVAVIHVPGADGAHVVATDNDDAAAFAKERFFAGRADYFQGDLPVRQATFERIGEGQPGSGWSYRFAGTEVSARWFVREPPVVAHGHLRPGNWCFTVLYFAEEAELHLNGSRVPGAPFTRDIWRTSIGGDRSSCVYALAETFLDTE